MRLPRGDRHNSPSAISLYRLQSSVSLAAKHLSYNSKPKRVAKIADLQASSNDEVHWHRKFACVTEEILTFELGCSEQVGAQCHLDWWQSDNSSAPGEYIKPHQPTMLKTVLDTRYLHGTTCHALTSNKSKVYSRYLSINICVPPRVRAESHNLVPSTEIPPGSKRRI